MKKHHCYGNAQIFDKTICFDDGCHLYYACRVATGDVVEMYEYKLVDLIIHTVPKKEVLELLMQNYDISYNAAKQAVKRWKKMKNDT